jgi:hypothetical protein
MKRPGVGTGVLISVGRRRSQKGMLRPTSPLTPGAWVNRPEPVAEADSRASVPEMVNSKPALT